MTIATTVSAGATDPNYTLIARGRYLFQAGDCAACHTSKGGKRLAGGRAIPTPFGTIYSTNITPDPETGIGKWSEDDFYRALHDGIRPNGDHLYPAFPFPWYTKLTRHDVHAIKTYLDTQKPVHQRNLKPEFAWPLNWRASAAAWSTLFFDKGTFRSNPKKSPEWNRGAYLVEGLEHCGACHSPKNMFGSVEESKAFKGGYGENWFSPDLDGDKRGGLGSWSVADIVEYLKTGSNRKSAASGPMAEVIEHSTQHLTDSDLQAIAVYLKDIPAEKGDKDESQSTSSDDSAFSLGKGLYVDNCTACHLDNGQGQSHAIPSLVGNSIVQAENSDTLLQTILEGGTTAATRERPTGLAMPPFAWKLNDKEVAALASYVRNAWGNHAGVVDEGDSGDVRQRIKDSHD